MTPSPTQSQINEALASFLASVFPDGDAVFKGLINETLLVVSNVMQGSINVGDTVLGLGVTPGTKVGALVAGPGGTTTYSVTPSQNVAATTMATGVSIVAGQVNRVPEPAAPDFIVMTPIRRRRLATNLDTLEDVQFTASISGTLMSVSTVELGAIEPGATVLGTGVAANTTVGQQQSGAPGGPGTYSVSPSQSVGSRVMGAGAQTYMQSTEIVFQLDFHSANVLDSADQVQVISTLFRDEYATKFFAALPSPLNAITPLHADDPRQVPFPNAENAWETRWILECFVQVNQVVSAPQPAADAIDLGVISVEEAFPA
jgi:hypothetical protein